MSTGFFYFIVSGTTPQPYPKQCPFVSERQLIFVTLPEKTLSADIQPKNIFPFQLSQCQKALAFVYIFALIILTVRENTGIRITRLLFFLFT